ncbi:MAG: response regulator [Deltaproteobacteria bacterium]|nr:response regulator [Deltaproteobacteria bacterium]
MSKIVLCVDDSATMQMVAEITFRGTDFTYVGARSVDEGLQKAKSQKPAIVLADSQMPGKTGYDLCQDIKASMPDVPVVILVGNGAPYDAAKGTQVGADANLPKPWDTQTMLEKVTEIVSKGATAKAGAAAAAPAAKPAAAAAPAATTPAAAAAAAAAANQPPRSSTIMGMPTIKMPAGVAPTVTPAAAAPGPAKTMAMAVPPVAANLAAQAGLRPPAQAAAPAAAAQPAAASTPVISGVGGMNRAPMVAGNATKRSKLVEATLAKMAARLAEATGLQEGSPELAALLKLSTEVVERVVWEVVPDLAEQIIRENLETLAASRRS